MYITWLGHSAFKFQDKIGSDGVTVITDPFDDKIGLRMPKIEADILTISHDHEDHNNTGAIKGKPFLIHCAGEYEIKNIAIEGVQVPHDDKDGKERGMVTAYRFDMDDISIAHLADLGGPLNSKQLETLGNVDVLLIPVGGKFTLDAKKAVEVVSQIEPRIVIPMHYAVPGLIYDLDSVDKFIKELGVKPRMEEKLKVTKRDLPQEDMELVILSY